MPKGRYQIFTDSNTKVISPYGPSGGGSSGTGSGSTSSGSKKVAVEKVTNRHGSSAGASSSEFHEYLGARNRERARIDEIETQKVLEEERKQMANKIQQYRDEAEERTAKNRLKRQKMKDRRNKNKRRKTEGKQGSISGSDGSDDDTDDEAERAPVAEGAPSVQTEGTAVSSSI